MKNELTPENAIEITQHKAFNFVKDLTGLIDDPRQQATALLSSGATIIKTALQAFPMESRLLVVQKVNDDLMAEFANEGENDA